jgi:hypothetical protein
LSIAVAAVLALAGSGAAQEKSSVLLNSVEVRQLVARAEPADNARLAAHFNALANRYSDEAGEHRAMAQNFVGNPNRSIATGMSAHCKRLAELNDQSAAVLRELAAHHQKLTSGVASTLPRGAETYQGGAGAREPTRQELKSLAAKAAAPADHRALEEYFLTLARRYAADAEDHVAMAAAYRGSKIAQAATHCDRLIALSRDEAKEANAAASMHKQLAEVSQR